MKKNTYYKWAAALVAASLTLSGCGKKEDPKPDGDGKTPPAEKAKPKPDEVKPKPDEVKPKPDEVKPEPVEVKPTPVVGKSSVKEQLMGSWGMTKESAVAMMKASMGGAGAAPEAMAMIEGMAEMMYDKMIVELGDGTATITSPDGVEKETFEFVSTDDATGAFVVKLTDEDGTEETGEGTVKGDTMTMTKDKETMNMVRLDAAELAKRKESIKNFDPASLIPPGLIPEGIEDLVVPPAPPIPEPAPIPVPGVE